MHWCGGIVMANYDFNIRAWYLSSDGTLIQKDTNSGLLWDDSGDDTFTTDDLLNENSIQWGYHSGTVEIGGETFIGINSFGIVYLWAQVPDPATFVFPASIDMATLNSDPFVVCFLAGTHIATPKGQRTVEKLAIGELVLTASGDVRPVRWIGHKTIVSRFADPLKAYPIRIAAGALGAELPARDLLVSPDHALLVDGALVQAGALVNGMSITRHTPADERFTWFHIELEDHALVLAEGAPAETYVDNVTRRRFDNYAEFAALYGDDDVAAIPELDLPRVKSARQLAPATRARLAVRAGARGLAPSVAA